MSDNAFKNWFDKSAANRLGDQVAAVLPSFDRAAFVRRASKGLAKLEFADRVRQFSGALAATLPTSIPKALGVLVDSLPAPLDTSDEVTDGWLQWPVGQFIADHGVPHFEESMVAMRELTQRFSAEFAVRPFVDQRPDETFAFLTEQLAHQSSHVRRWCSEGVRPRLPWGKTLRGLVADPSPIWPILEALKDDPELYVRRSVANNLGDIAKDHPKDAVRRARGWAKGASEDRQWVIKHGLRALIKAGDTGALAAIGIVPPKKIEATLSLRPKKIRIGDSVEMTASIRSAAARGQDLVVDYVVHYVRQRDKTGAKVFKWKTLRIPARGDLELAKKHAMRETTIRALYPGKHRVELQINGTRVAEAAFVLAQ